MQPCLFYDSLFIKFIITCNHNHEGAAMFIMTVLIKLIMSLN